MSMVSETLKVTAGTEYERQEVHLDFQPGTLAYIRARCHAAPDVRTKFLNFDLCRAVDGVKVVYLHNSLDPPTSKWVYRHEEYSVLYTVLYTDFDLERVPAVNLQQQLYISCGYNAKERIYVLDTEAVVVKDSGGSRRLPTGETPMVGGAYTFLRPMRAPERPAYEKRLVETSIRKFLRSGQP